jgi:DNA-binding transcriptional LysR family regulator
MAKHPKVTLDVTLSDRMVDLVEEGYDMAVRIARLPSSSLVSRKLASTRLILCASPSYLKKHSKPKHPSELADHAVLSYSLLVMGEQWEFEGPEGNFTVPINPVLRTNSGDTCRAAALGHQGVILQPSFIVGDDLRKGTLVELMPEYRSLEFGIHAIYPSRRYVSPKVRVLIDYLSSAMRSVSWS